ncbi:MAG: hypothetical protein PVF51_07090 [Nitrospirota bacterium]|jgi:N-acetylmuramoyl-L-alanine amidase
MPETRIGEYRVRSGNADAPFWRIAPGTEPLTLFWNTYSTQIALTDPTAWNTVTMPPPFGLFDIVVRMSEPVVERSLTDAQSVGLLTTTLSGQPANTPMPMWEGGSGTVDNRVANISFAVRIPRGQQHFEGTLVLTAENAGVANAGTKTVRLPLRVGRFERVANLFVQFVATPRRRKPGERYCWIQVPVVDWVGGAGPPAPLEGAEVVAKILRDNYRRGFNGRNRRVALRSDSGGLAAFRHSDTERTVLGFPTGWPLIFTATQNRHVSRAHLVRLEQADIDHNQNPHRVSAIQAIAVAVASVHMASKTILVDPGHGVVYGFASQRRSQEWFVAHRIGTRVREILRTRFAVPAANLFMTRTAGFGLIDPGELNRNDAPERGAQRFVFEIAGRRLRIRQAALGLQDLSDLVLTGNDDRPANITEADRNRLITSNAVAVAAIITRIENNLPAGQRVRPGSVHWDTATNRYVCVIERHPPVAGHNAIVDAARNVAITTHDWFILDAAMLENLADRTARWSSERELGSGPGANAATGRPAFRTAVQAAMTAEHARRYIREKIIAELDLEEPYLAGAAIPNQYRNKETMGWHYRVRRDYINRKNCDVALTIHENAGGLTSAGMAMLVGRNPPNDQMRAAKLFMKYVDPFDQGLRRGGIVESGAGQLSAHNARRAKHVYFELEFMTSTILDNPGVRAADDSRYQYQAMVESAFIDRVAEQIVAGVVEFLLEPQGDIATISYDLSNLPTW